MILKPKCFVFILFLLFAIASSQAQDYQISFAGTGASATVGSVTVENLTQGKSITLSGTETLHLVATITGTHPIIDGANNALRIYPNPMIDNSTIDFIASAPGKASIELFDIAGRKIGSAQNTFTVGAHSFRISGLRMGIYTVKISSQAYTYTSKLVSSSTSDSDLRISYIGNSEIPITTKVLKSANAEKIMQYTTGDRLKYTGSSGIYSTIVTDVPTQSKTLAFTFVACTDADGNSYPVVQIGTQVWMAENLKTTKYNDRKSIQYINGNIDWSNLTTPAYCWNNNNAENRNLYGGLYNWSSVKTGKLAPYGWHVSTDEEWITLTTYLDRGVAGGKLKKTGTGSWESPNIGATNETGFTALPAGCRHPSGVFDGIGASGYWWTSTESSTDKAWSWSISFLDEDVYRVDTKDYGFSVRCIKDDYTTIPIIFTDSVTNITTTSAICNVSIAYNGGESLIEKGVCWNTTGTPTISDNKTIENNESVNFTSNTSGLTPYTNYYLRAYAVNSKGIAYGDQIEFRTDPLADTNIVTDIDGNIYHTVTIGTQVWLIENLKTTKLNDGTVIPNVTENTAWGNNKSPAYCWYNNDISNKNNNGALYNWYTVNTGKLAPKGWHVPTVEEWKTLELNLITILGDIKYVAKSLASKTDWLTSYKETYVVGNDLTKNNTSGFTALPSGYRAGEFRNIGETAYWWSSDKEKEDWAFTRFLSYDRSSLTWDNDNMVLGLSVRCIKD
ncbi:MAG: FISUMP domain-containing protein [Prolixibacteraceae bacterium]